VIIVSDTSAITNLAAIGQLTLLQRLYGKVIIPEAVFQELVKPPISSGGEEATKYDWIQVRSVQNRTVVEECLQSLDIGESEAIALALEMKADLLLVDENDARKIAKGRGIKRTGVLGVLIDAKDKGFIDAIRPLIVILKNEADFWLSKELCNEVLKDAKEKPL